MISDYNKTKAAVLATYEEFLPLLTAIKGNKDSSFDSSLELLAGQAQNIRQDRFLLMVVGEAKSGKSTFINAYLGEEILPMDVKQCTSAIVEIRYDKAFTLTATYADEHTEVIKDEQKIKEFLAVNAAMDDNYRDIPISAINFEILMKYKDKKIPTAIIDDFIKGVQTENLYHLSEKEYNWKIRKYIEVKQPNWKDIVQKIEIRYPFADKDLKGVEIVDTPGVNADGRVGNITDAYVEKANAVMFLKPITGAALEASSFKQFLNSKSADRNRNAMFLILTRAANETQENITRIHQEALKQFPNIDEKQIIPIDSKVMLFYNRIKNLTIEEIEQLITEEVAANRLDSFIAMPWFMSNRNRDEFLRRLLELSQFDVMNAALNKFSHKIQYIGLNDFLARMLSVVEKATDTLTENVGFYKEKAEDPIELGNRMNKIKAELEEMTLKINQTVEAIAFEYGKTGGFIDTRVKEEIENYQKEIAAIDPGKPLSIDELEKISFRKIDMLTAFGNALQKEIVAKCDKALISLSDKSSIKFTTLKPDITKESFQKVKDDLRSSPGAQESYTYETGITFTKTEHGSRFSQSKYYGLVKNDIERRIERLRNQIVRELKYFVTATTTAYSEELSRNAKIKREELNTITQEKQTAEEIQAKIEELEGLIKNLATQKENILSLKGGIEKHV